MVRVYKSDGESVDQNKVNTRVEAETGIRLKKQKDMMPFQMFWILRHRLAMRQTCIHRRK